MVMDLSRLLVPLQSSRSLCSPDWYLVDPRGTLGVQIALLRNKCSPTHLVKALIRSLELPKGRERKVLVCFADFDPEQKLLELVQTILLVGLCTESCQNMV